MLEKGKENKLGRGKVLSTIDKTNTQKELSKDSVLSAIDKTEHNTQKELSKDLSEMLKEMPKNVGSKGQLIGKESSGSYMILPPEKQPTLKEIGIEKHESSRYQKIAELPEEEGTIVEEGEGES